METITYSKKKFITEQHEFQIGDSKNVFLEGRSEYDNTARYLGVWVDSKGLKEVVLEPSNIRFFYSRYPSESTTITIQKFLEECYEVKEISRASFARELNYRKAILTLDDNTE